MRLGETLAGGGRRRKLITEDGPEAKYRHEPKDAGGAGADIDETDFVCELFRGGMCISTASVQCRWWPSGHRSDVHRRESLHRDGTSSLRHRVRDLCSAGLVSHQLEPRCSLNPVRSTYRPGTPNFDYSCHSHTHTITISSRILLAAISCTITTRLASGLVFPRVPPPPRSTNADIVNKP